MHSKDAKAERERFNDPGNSIVISFLDRARFSGRRAGKKRLFGGRAGNVIVPESYILLKRLNVDMRLLIAVIAASLLLLPALAFAQDYDVIKSERSESFRLPYAASNQDYDGRLVYTFDEPKQPSWILLVMNNISYVPSNDSKTFIRIQEPAPSEKYIEIVMFGGESKRYWVAVNTPEAGYARMYDNQQNGWTTEGPITVTHGENSGLTVTNGKRIVLDRLNLDGFAVDSIEIYGSDNETQVANAYAGDIRFEILFGSFSESPVYYVPLGVTLGVGGLIIGLLIFKKRKPE